MGVFGYGLPAFLGLFYHCIKKNYAKVVSTVSTICLETVFGLSRGCSL